MSGSTGRVEFRFFPYWWSERTLLKIVLLTSRGLSQARSAPDILMNAAIGMRNSGKEPITLRKHVMVLNSSQTESQTHCCNSLLCLGKMKLLFIQLSGALFTVSWTCGVCFAHCLFLNKIQ
jgi:hypothetical protein